MSQFDQIGKNIALENEKCGYNPEKDTNWRKLTYFMQRECVRRMDAKTKIRLSQTCKAERSRVFSIASYGLDTDNLKLQYIAENIASITKKSDYNPKKDMNWDLLPMEMRNECVKWMDFKTRCYFRRVSKTERALIDFKKYRFKYLHIEFSVHSSFKDSAVYAGTRIGEWEIDTLPNRFADYRCIPAILKHAELEEFNLHGEDDSFRFPYNEILEVALTMNAELQFSYVNAEDFLKFLMGLVQKWIDNDVGAGKSVQFHMMTRGVIDQFAEKFADRIIEKTDEIVRIRMNNEKMQVLLRLIGCEHEEDVDEQEYCSCKVIPIDSPESEYENGDEWIESFYDIMMRD